MQNPQTSSQHNRQEKRCVSDDQMHALFTGAKGHHICLNGFQKMQHLNEI